MLILGGERRYRLAGLVLALTFSSFIVGLCFASIYFDMRSDRWHPQAATSYRLLVGSRNPVHSQPPAPFTPDGYAAAIRNNVPAVRHVARLVVRQRLVAWNPDAPELADILYADDAFPDIFSFGVTRENLLDAARERRLFLTARTARKWFGAEDPTGRAIKVNQAEFTVGRVLPDPPGSSHLRFDVVMPMALLERVPSAPATAFETMTYVNTAVPIDNKILNQLSVQFSELTGMKRRLVQAQALPGIIFSKPLQNDRVKAGGGRDIFVAGALAIIVLIGAISATSVLLAAIVSRQRETLGVLNALGRSRGRLWRDVMGEVALLSGIAIVASMALSMLLFRPILLALDKQVAGPAFLLSLGVAISLSLALICLAVSFAVWRALQGSVTAMIRGGAGETVRGSVLAFMLIAVQVALGFSVILFCLGVRETISGYLGASRPFAEVWMMTAPTDLERERMVANLQQSPLVRDITLTGWTPFRSAYTRYIAYPGARVPTQGVEVKFLKSRENVVQQFGAELRFGRWLSAGDSWTGSCAVLANELAISELFRTTRIANASDALGRSITITSERGPVSCRIAGMVGNLRFEHASVRAMPELYAIDAQADHFIIVRTRADTGAATLLAVARQGIVSNLPVPRRLGDIAKTAYSREARAEDAFSAAAVILFGLIIYTLISTTMLAVETKRVEIGVRRAFGATWGEIGTKVVAPFLVPMLAGIVIGYPLYKLIEASWQGGGELQIVLSGPALLLAMMLTALPFAIAAAIGWRMMTVVEPAEVLRTL